MAFCLPKKYSKIMQDAIRSGDLHPNRLKSLDSEGRRAAFGKYVDPESAKQLNLKFEKQLLLKDQQKAMVNFINDIQGLNEKVKKDLVDQVMGLQDAISPKNARGFLEDFVSKKLGAVVDHDEAKQMLNLAQTAEKSKAEWQADLGNDAKREQFGVDLVKLNDYTNELKGNNETAWNKVMNIYNISKGIEATWDYSASLVQASAMVTSRRFWESFVKMFQYGWSEEEFIRQRGNILTHPYYQMAKENKLAIKGINDKLSPNEEFMGTNLIEHANEWLKTQSGGYIPNITRGADRAFMGFLNNIRFQAFVDAVDAAKLRGEDISVKEGAVRDIAENINTFTGHGNVGPHDSLGNAVPFINLFTWTIRKVTSTLTLMSPVPWMKSSPTARAFATRQMMGYLTATASLYGLARMTLGPKNVPLDPSDTHFGWIKVGDTWHNLFQGDKIVYGRLLWRLATGRIVDGAGVEKRFARNAQEIITGEHPKIDDRNDSRGTLIQRFGRGKLNPNMSILADALTEKDYMGADVGVNVDTVEREFKAHFYPMSLSSLFDVMQNSHDNTVGQVLSMLNIFGASSYVDTPQSRQGLTAWGDDLAGLYKDKSYQTLDEKLLDINTKMQFPPKTVNGVKLTDKQYHDYITIFGQSAKQQLQEAIDSGEWDNSSPEEKKEGWKNALKVARKMAGVAMMLNSQDNNDGEDNPIFDQMQDNNTEPKTTKNIARLEKAGKQTLKKDVSTEDLEKQWHRLILQNYDFGKLASTNPLAFLGYQAMSKMPGGIANNIRETTLETNYMGTTYPEKNPVTRDMYDSEYSWKTELEALKRAGLDPNSAMGKIVLGPQFFRDGIFSLEHELMHKGLQELVKRTAKDSTDNVQAKFGQRNDEPLMRAYQVLKGTNGQEYPKDLGWSPKYYLEKNYPQVAKNPKAYADILDSIQEIAKNYVNKGK